MDIDHIFVFVEPEGPEGEALRRLGLVETYRREHPGQGTANACFAFEQVFLELLWMTSEAEACSPPIRRTRLWERSQWRTLGTCPFGLAFRGDLASAGVACWTYRPPYLGHLLPEGVGIQVAVASDDPMQPMLFSFPGSTPPSDWPPNRRGELQRAGGWQGLGGITLHAPREWCPSDALIRLADTVGLVLKADAASGFHLEASLEPHVAGSARAALVLPCQ